MTSVELQTANTTKKGLTWEKAQHLPIMWLPNVLNPHKLGANIKHPFHEVFHTRHDQYALDEHGFYVVEHRFFGRLVTIDVIQRTDFEKGFVARIKQLFDRNFYYGHADYFPQPFQLIDRTYINNKSFDKNSHLERFRQ